MERDWVGLNLAVLHLADWYDGVPSGALMPYATQEIRWFIDKLISAEEQVAATDNGAFWDTMIRELQDKIYELDAAWKTPKLRTDS